AARWTVVRPDYSGSGGTVDGGGLLSLAALPRPGVATAAAAGAAPFHLLGFSLAAAGALPIAADHPAARRGVAALGAFLRAADARMQPLLRLWRDVAGRDRETMPRLGLLTCVGPDCLARFAAGAVEGAVAEDLAGNDWGGLLRQVD